jgi:hypothetical protein
MDLEERLELHIPRKYLLLIYHAVSTFYREKSVEFSSDFYIMKGLLERAIHDFEGSDEVIREGFKSRQDEHVIPKKQKQKKEKKPSKLKGTVDSEVTNLSQFIIPPGMHGSHCAMPSWFSTRALGALHALLEEEGITEERRINCEEVFQKFWKIVNDSSSHPESIDRMVEEYLKAKSDCNYEPSFLCRIAKLALSLYEERHRTFSSDTWD